MPRLLICGAINWDTTLFVEKLPGPGEEVRVERILSVPGGKGANAAVAASRILGKKVVGLVGMLGNDLIADRQLAVLGEEGVDTACVSCTNDILSGQVAHDSKHVEKASGDEAHSHFIQDPKGDFFRFGQKFSHR